MAGNVLGPGRFCRQEPPASRAIRRRVGHPAGLRVGADPREGGNRSLRQESPGRKAQGRVGLPAPRRRVHLRHGRQDRPERNTDDRLRRAGHVAHRLCRAGRAHLEAEGRLHAFVGRFRAGAGSLRHEDDPGHYRLQRTKIAVLRGNETVEQRSRPRADPAFPAAATFSRHAQDDPGNARSHRHGRAAGQERARKWSSRRGRT